MDLELRGKRALVTGGSRGIGRACVLALARQGARVAAVYNRESDAVRSLAAELEATGDGSYVVQADVADAEGVERLVADARSRLGGLDVLVNNAGVVSHAMLADLELDEWRRVVDTNLTGLFLVTKHAVAAMPAGGSIVIIGSGVALRGMPGRVHYASSKAGAVGMTRALCKELGPRGIRTNLIAPGIIETDQTAGLTPEGRARYEKLTALQRLGAPEEIADVVVFLASDLSRYVTGQTIYVDGGI
ncbi:MAG: SDR family oxidoreductase [Thermoleophilia bacterium]|nr:SDR family oxidoreductase [Thermoleophilia bacterium]